jgi:hypothetical protein
MNGRRCIATFGAEDHADLLALSLPTFKRYAELHGYDLQIVPCTSYGRPPPWGKIPALQKLLITYSDVLWLDADVVVISPEEDVASLVPSTSIQALTVHVNRNRSLVPNTGVWLLRPCMRPYLAMAWGMT